MKKKLLVLIVLSLASLSILAVNTQKDVTKQVNKVVEKKDLPSLKKEIDVLSKQVQQFTKQINVTENQLKDAKKEDKVILQDKLKKLNNELTKSLEKLENTKEEYGVLNKSEKTRIYKLALENLDSLIVDSLYYEVCVKDSSNLLGIAYSKLDSASIDSLYRAKCLDGNAPKPNTIYMIISGVGGFVLGIICILLAIAEYKRSKKKKFVSKPKITIKECDKTSIIANFKIKDSK